MRILVAVLAVAVVVALLIPSAAEAGEQEGIVPGLVVSKTPGVNSNPRFEQFFQEFKGMVRSWWQHGGFRTTQDKWQVMAQEVVRPGQKLTHFVIVIWREGRGELKLQFVLSFAIPPFAQGNLFLASHAAYDATLGAIMGESRFQGNLEWKGPGIGETVFLRDLRGIAQSRAQRPFLFVCPEYPDRPKTVILNDSEGSLPL